MRIVALAQDELEKNVIDSLSLERISGKNW